MDFTDKWRLFECAFLSDARKYIMNWSVFPKGKDWDNWILLIVKFIICYIIEAAGFYDICEPF